MPWDSKRVMSLLERRAVSRPATMSPELRQAGEIDNAALDGLVEVSAFEGRLFAVVDDDGVGFAHGIEVDFATQEGVGADGVEVRALFQPRALQDWFGGVGGGYDDIGFGGGLRVVDGFHGDADLLGHALGELISAAFIAAIGQDAGDVSDGADGGDLRKGLCSDADDADGLACIFARHVFCGNAARRAGAEGSEPIRLDDGCEFAFVHVVEEDVDCAGGIEGGLESKEAGFGVAAGHDGNGAVRGAETASWVVDRPALTLALVGVFKRRDGIVHR